MITNTSAILAVFEKAEPFSLFNKFIFSRARGAGLFAVPALLAIVVVTHLQLLRFAAAASPA